MIQSQESRRKKFLPFKHEVELSPPMNKSFRITKNKFLNNDSKNTISNILTIDHKCLISYGSHPLSKENKTFVLDSPEKKMNSTISNFMKNYQERLKREKRTQANNYGSKTERKKSKDKNVIIKGNFPLSKTQRSSDLLFEKINSVSCSKNRNTIDIVSKDLYQMGAEAETKVRKIHTHSPGWNKQENFVKLIQALRKTQKNDESFQMIYKETEDSLVPELKKQFVKNRKLHKLKQTIQEINSSRGKHLKKNFAVEKLEPWALDEKNLDFTIEDY